MLEPILYVALEAILTALIIAYVPYTEIDWQTYMQHVRLFIRGVRDYPQITGDTGPAVYPAGYLYAFTVLYVLSGGGRDIVRAQWMFLSIYTIQCILVGSIFKSLNIKPKWAVLLMLCSKRIHSIYVLRLFNDCLSVMFMYIALIRVLRKRFMSGTVFWSLSVGIKMGSLLYAPAMAIILVREAGWLEALEMGAWFVLIQGFLAVPFARRSVPGYLRQAFDFGRQFDFKWTVNWRFVGEAIFGSSKFQATLLVLHVATLLLFAHYRWLDEDNGGILSLFCPLYKSRNGQGGEDADGAAVVSDATIEETDRQRDGTKYGNRWRPWSARKMAVVLFECNLIGVIFARSLHYQHYSWYYHSVWFLLLMTNGKVPLIAKAAIAGAIEYGWNVYPSTVLSSLVLCAANAVLLLLPRQPKQ